MNPSYLLLIFKLPIQSVLPCLYSFSLTFFIILSFTIYLWVKISRWSVFSGETHYRRRERVCSKRCILGTCSLWRLGVSRQTGDVSRVSAELQVIGLSAGLIPAWSEGKSPPLLRLPVNHMRPTHVMEVNLLYFRSAELNVNLILKILPQKHIECLTAT